MIFALQRRARRGLMFYLMVLLAGCSVIPSERLLYEGDGAAVIFNGHMHGNLPGRGELRFAASDTVFSGRFDDNGFPERGELTQVYIDRGGERLQLSLRGRFDYEESSEQLQFNGEFSLRDSQHRLLAEADDSRWLSSYPSAAFRLAPPLFSMDGEQRYRQYRHDISPASAVRRFLRIYRPMSGPFVVTVRYQDGVPRGMAQIKREVGDGEHYVIERQYFNYQLADQRSHYYYFEPGSFERMSVIGGCEAPHLTVPQDLLSVYAYDCDRANFLALNKAMPASVLTIASEHLDNSGRFHKIGIHHHGSTAEFDVDAEALERGELRAHGLYLDWHYGQLRSAYRAAHGHPVGIGIDRPTQGQPYYSSHMLSTEKGRRPVSAERSQLLLSTEELASALDTVFKRYGSSGSLSERRARILRESIAKVFHRPAPAVATNYPGLLSLYQQWLHESGGLVKRWPWNTRRSAKDIDTLRRALLGKQQQFSAQQRLLLTQLSTQYCESQGQSFDAQGWQCSLQVGDEMRSICQRAYGAAQCQQMQTRLIAPTE